MIQLSKAAFIDLARRFGSAEEFGRFLIDNRVSLRAERKARREGREVTQGGPVESGLRVEGGLVAEADSRAGKPVSTEGLQHPKVKLAVARKAAPLLGLGPNAGEVFAALLDFCDTDTLRCCPGLDAIADKLGRIGAYRERHVRRGIRRLVEAGLLRVAVNAGMGHANAYFPQWDRLAEIAASLETRVRVEADSLSRSVRQTQKKIHTSDAVRRVQGARDPTGPDRRQMQMALLAVVPEAPNRMALAEGEARKRLAADVLLHASRFGPNSARQWMATIPQLAWDAGRRAELNRRGSGLRMLLDTRFEMETEQPLAAGGGKGLSNG